MAYTNCPPIQPSASIRAFAPLVRAFASLVRAFAPLVRAVASLVRAFAPLVRVRVPVKVIGSQRLRRAELVDH